LVSLAKLYLKFKQASTHHLELYISGRKHYTPEEKVAILMRHLVEDVPISDLCDELGLQPTVFYRWQKEFFENGAAAFQQRNRTNHQAEEERIAHLERKIQTKDEVLVELMAEHVALKKRVGEL
jgi:transposase